MNIFFSEVYLPFFMKNVNLVNLDLSSFFTCIIIIVVAYGLIVTFK